MENKIADVRKRLEAEGVTHATLDQIQRIAAIELAADKARSDEGKKPPKEKRHAKSADQQVDSDLQAVRDRTAALVAETAAVGLSYQEGEKRKIALDLEQAALAKLRDEAIKKGETDLSGIKISEDQRRKIDEVSEAYAMQAEELRRVRENQEQVEQASNDFYDSFKSGMLDAVTGARSLSDALADILKKLSQMLLNSAFDSLFKPTSGGVGGGPLGGIFSAVGGLFGGGGGAGSTGDPWAGLRFANGGPVSGPGSGTSDSILAHLSNGEFVVNANAAARHRGLLEAINAGMIPGFAVGGSVGTPSVSTPSVSVPHVPSAAAVAPASPAGGGDMNVTIAVEVSGARGNQEISEFVNKGVAQGIKQFSESDNFKRIAARGAKDALGRGWVR